jgi:hypothetical protein
MSALDRIRARLAAAPMVSDEIYLNSSTGGISIRLGDVRELVKLLERRKGRPTLNQLIIAGMRAKRPLSPEQEVGARRVLQALVELMPGAHKPLDMNAVFTVGNAPVSTSSPIPDRCVRCGHTWAQHTKLPWSAIPCRQEGCACKDWLNPSDPEARDLQEVRELQNLDERESQAAQDAEDKAMGWDGP